MNAIDLSKPATHLATLNGQTLRFNAEDFDSVLPEFVKASGGGVPVVEELRTGDRSAVLVHTAPDSVKSIPLSTGRKPVARTSPVAAPKIEVGSMDAEGRERSERDRDAAVLAGFAPRQPVFERGLRATGMDRHKAEFEALPETHVAMSELVGAVAAENRKDVEVDQAELRMTRTGLLVNKCGEHGRVTMALGLDERAIGALSSRLGMNSAGKYLASIRPEVRAININQWCANDVPAREAKARAEVQAMNASIAAKGGKQRPMPEAETVVLRTRDSKIEIPGVDRGRSVFGVVSDGYAPFDADLVGRAIAGAVKATDSRAEVHYDGYRTKVDVMWFSDVKPEHAVAGEYFKAGVRVRTDDTGGGSCRVSAVVWQNLCLNFIIIDQAAQDIAVIRHVGDVAKLARLFENAFKKAETKLGHFLEAWGHACEEDVLSRSFQSEIDMGTIDDVKPFVGLPVSKVLPGIFNGIVERELVPVPRRNRDQVVGDLMSMWSKDVSGATLDREGKLTRAAVVNAFTRYAHEINVDPFKAHDIEAAAGSLLYGRKGATPAALPFIPMG